MITGGMIKALLVGMAIGYFLRHIDAVNKLLIKFVWWRRNKKDIQW